MNRDSWRLFERHESNNKKETQESHLQLDLLVAIWRRQCHLFIRRNLMMVATVTVFGATLQPTQLSNNSSGAGLGRQR